MDQHQVKVVQPGLNEGIVDPQLGGPVAGRHRLVVMNNSSRGRPLSLTAAPAVMKQINKLEQELGVALFTRTSTGVTLTPAGKGFKATPNKSST